MEFKSILDAGHWVAPSVMKHEKEYNVFMRCRVPEVQAKVQANINKQLPANPNERAATVMAYLRKWKSENFNPTK